MRNLALVGVFEGGFTAAEDVAANRMLGELAQADLLRPELGSSHAFGDVPDVLAALVGSVPPGKITVTIDHH